MEKSFLKWDSAYAPIQSQITICNPHHCRQIIQSQRAFWSLLVVQKWRFALFATCVSKYLILTLIAGYRKFLFKRISVIHNNWNLPTGELTKIVSNFHFRWDQLCIYKELRARIFTPYCFQQFAKSVKY